jgi:Bacterial regulatory helix-turn-helix protein, lysR family
MEKTLSLNSPDAVTIEARSMSEVAQQKHRSQSAISRLMASLERVLSLTLFERTPRGIEPTPHRRALIAIHNRSRHMDVKNDVKWNDPRQTSPGRREVIQMAATITLTYPFSAEDTTLLNKLLGNSGGTTTGGITSGGATTGATGVAPGRAAVGAAITPPEEYFPADPGIAKFPSPENSQILVFNGKISGRPYLKDQAGAIHQIKKDAAGIPQYFKNDQLVPVFPGEAVGQCLVRQGEVYMQIASGIWKHVEPNGTMYNKALPPAWTTSSGGSTTPNLPPLAPLPKPSAVAPGSSGRVIPVGPSRALKTLSAAIPTAAAGDKIQLDPGTYTDTPAAWSVPLLIDLGGATFNAAGKTATLASGKALLCPRADSIIQNGTITNVAMDQPRGELTSAIRPDAGCGYLTINRMTLANNQCGVGHGGFPIVIAISDTNISGNGLKANSGSLTHNLYVGIECRRLTLTNVISNGTNEAHAVKYRGPELIVNGGTFASAPGKPFDIPNGTTVPFKITEATIIKGANDPDHGVLAYGEEGTDNGLAGGTISGGSIRANCDNPMILGPGGTITLNGVALSGNKITASGGVVLVGA